MPARPTLRICWPSVPEISAQTTAYRSPASAARGTRIVTSASTSSPAASASSSGSTRIQLLSSFSVRSGAMTKPFFVTVAAAA